MKFSFLPNFDLEPIGSRAEYLKKFKIEKTKSTKEKKGGNEFQPIEANMDELRKYIVPYMSHV